VVGVARLYRDVASVLVIDTTDEHLAPAVEAEGLRCVVSPTIMAEPGVAEELAQTCLDAIPPGPGGRS